MKLGSPAFKVLQKIEDEINSRTLAKNGEQLNENLSWETIFLATTIPPVHIYGQIFMAVGEHNFYYEGPMYKKLHALICMSEYLSYILF